MRTPSFNRKEFKLQRVKKRITRATSRTEVAFLCRTATWCAIRFPFLKQWTFQLQELQWTKIRATGERNNCLYVACWFTQRFLLLVKHNHNSKKNRSQTIQVREPHQTHYTHRKIQNRFFWLFQHWASMEIEILYFIQERYGDKDFAKVMASSRHLARYGEGPVGQSFVHFKHTRQQNIAYWRKARRRLQSWRRRFDRAQIRTGHRHYIEELPDSSDSSVHAPSTDSDSEDFDYEAFTARNDQRAQVSQTSSSTTTQSWTYGSRSQKKISDGKVIGNMLAADIRKTYGTHQSTTLDGGYLNTERSFTRDRCDTTDTTCHDSHRIYAKQCVQFVLQLWILYCPDWANVPEILFRYIGLREMKANSSRSNDSEEN